ncbi:MAG: hypoxanthine phosphoribosyltransferase [Prevotellaceae bacterium]|jgi:hypoxanthine phosphoribosyltransferase|nr:hypoxanthine phosphoribosyltransferase [Prevotellaceae bacterium]
MKKVTLHDKIFALSIPDTEIQQAVEKVAAQINKDMAGETPVFVGLLNGAFMFAADLLKLIEAPCEVSFIKYFSYAGTQSLGEVSELIGLNTNLKNRTVIILEDIIDTGLTISRLLNDLQSKGLKQVKIATLLFKPDAFKENYAVDYIGISIPNDFIVGYGLDYDELGRNLKDIYTLVQ